MTLAGVVTAFGLATAAQAAPTESTSAVASTATKKPIIIGEIVDLTGGLVDFNRVANPGYDFGWSDVNKRGGINGARVKVIKVDTGTVITQAPLLVRKLVSQGAVAILGPYQSNMGVASAPIAEQAGIPMILPTSIAAWQGSFNPWTFRLSPSLPKVLPAYMKAMVKKLNIKKLAVIYDKANNASVTEYNTLKSIEGELSIDLSTIQSITTGDLDFTAQITTILNSRPDSIWVGALSTEAALIMRQLRSRGYGGDFLSSSTLNNPAILSQSGGAAQGLITYQVFNPGGTDPSTKHLSDLYFKFTKTRNVPGTIGQTYSATQVLANALRKAKNPYNRASVRAALAQTTKFKTVMGPVTWRGSGDNVNTFFYPLKLGKDGFAPLG